MPFYQGKKDFGEKFIEAPTTWTSQTTKIAKKGDVLMSVRAPVGPVNFSTEEICIGRGLAAIRSGDALNRDFLYYQLLHLQPDIAGREGAVFASINKAEIEALPLAFASLPEQQRIVGILDEAFERIATAKANCEKNLQNARALFESHLNAVFTQRGEGWELKHLREVCEKITDGTHQTPTYFDDGYIFLSSRNVTSRRINWDSVKYIDQKQHTEMQRRVAPRLNDILLAKNGTTGIAALVDKDVTFDIYVSLALLRARAMVLPRFLLHFVNSPVAKHQFNKRLKGVGVPNLHLEEIREVLLPLPSSLDEQAKIVSSLDHLVAETQRLESLYQRKLAALDELKKSLLHQAFSGQLTAKISSSTVVPFPVKLPNINTTDLHAGILAMAYQHHEQKGNPKHFGHVKAEKIAHMVEAWLGIDLEREPIKDAAGPNDYPHQMKVEHRARMAGYFDFQQVKDAGYRVTKFKKFDSLIDHTRERLGDRVKHVDELLELMLPMNTQQAEIFCTVYAAWNNLLLDGQQPSDEAIVFESRENWHEAKLKIPREKFFTAIGWLKEHNIMPRGRGRKVLAKGKKK